MRHPSEIDDLHLEHSDLDQSWAHGEIELAEERPATALSADPTHRKWMMIGVGGCGLVTAIVVLLLTRDAGQAQAAQTPEVEQAALEQPAEAPAVEPTEPPTPAAEAPKPTLAASSRAAVVPSSTPPTPVSAQRESAPPSPSKAESSPSKAASSPSKAESSPSKAASSPSKASPSKASPSKASPSKPASSPSKPASAPAKPTAAGDPSLPADDQSSSGPLSDLPDVEGWDEADAAVEREEPSTDPAPAAAEPPELDEGANTAV